MKNFYVYIMTNGFHNVLYVGMTNNLSRRVWEHKEKQIDGFSKKYNLNKLIYYELHHLPDEAISREKSLKRWRRSWKNELINGFNPDWQDLYSSIMHG